MFASSVQATSKGTGGLASFGFNCGGFVGFQLLNSMVEKLRNYDDEPLPQDLQEGVDDDEWVCKIKTFFVVR